MKKNYKGKPRPKLEDFYDEMDPRGCSSSEYYEFKEAEIKWLRDNEDN